MATAKKKQRTAARTKLSDKTTKAMKASAQSKKTSKNAKSAAHASGHANSVTQTASIERHPRRLKEPKHRAFHLTKSRLRNNQPITGSFRIAARSVKLIFQHKRLFAGILLVFVLFNIAFVKGLESNLDLGSLKSAFKSAGNGTSARLFLGTTLFSYILSSGTATGGSTTVYQTIAVLIVSLAIIWALRKASAGESFTIRDAYYKSMYPLIPFVLVLITIGLQLLPMAVGAWLYSTFITGQILVAPFEKFSAIVITTLLILLSLYMMCSSLFALYIVTLPDTSPMKALRSARQLVLHRRARILRKILFLPVAIFCIGAVIMLPVIIFATGAAEWVYFALVLMVPLFTHSYMYTLYRELL